MITDPTDKDREIARSIIDDAMSEHWLVARNRIAFALAAAREEGRQLNDAHSLITGCWAYMLKNLHR